MTAVSMLALAMIFTGCSGSKTGSDKPAPSNAPAPSADAQKDKPATGGSALDDAMAGKLKGTKVKMFGPFTDADQVKFENSIKSFEEKTGIDIRGRATA